MGAHRPEARKPPNYRCFAGFGHEWEAGFAGCWRNSGGNSRLTKDDLGGDTCEMMIEFPVFLVRAITASTKYSIDERARAIR